MRRSRLLLGLVPALPMLVAIASCASPEAAQIGLVMRAPQGVLQRAKAVDLSVFDAAKGSCDAATGHVPRVPTEDDGTSVFSLENTGCGDGVAWCKKIDLDKDGSTKMFAVVARNEGGVLAEGCATAKISKSPLDVPIKVHIANAEKCCNDGVLQMGEQCEGPAVGGVCGGIAETETCDAMCVSKPIVLANASDNPPLTKGGEAKSELAMAFCPGEGELVDGLRTVYTSRSSDATGDSDIHVRVLNSEMEAVNKPFPFSHQLRIPVLCTKPAGAGSSREQRSPSIAPVSAIRTAVVFASNEDTASVYEVFLSAQTQDGCAEQEPFKISVKSKPGEHALGPDVAGGPDRMGLAVWVRGAKARGRIWKAPLDGIGPGELIPADLETEIDLTPNALNVSDVRVAGGPTGWVIVYAGKGSGDDAGIFMATVSPSGSVGPEVLVNAATIGVQDQPDVAELAGGARMVVWKHDGDIYSQRYAPDGTLVGDQFEPLNEVRDGEQQRPVVAASGKLGEFFVIAWEDGNDGISARFADAAGGFLQNSVNGQNIDFSAVYSGSAGIRRRPAVAVGGHVAIGWHDESVDNPGVFVRRFPLPKQ